MAESAKPQAREAPQQIRFKTEFVTPAMADEWLKRNNPLNRTMNQAAIDRYVAEMLNDTWDYTHQAVAFDRDDVLIDGQHRLTALILAAKKEKAIEGFWMVVARYPDAGCSKGVDRGTTRKHGHILEMRQIVPKGLGSRFSSYARGLFLLSMNSLVADDYEAVSEEIFLKCKADITSAHYLLGKDAFASSCAAVAYALPVAKEKIEEMIQQVRDNNGLVKHTGAWHFRRVLDGDHKTKIDKGEAGRLMKSLIFLKCIMLHLKGETVKDLKVLREFDGKEVDPDCLTYFRKARVKAGAGEAVF